MKEGMDLMNLSEIARIAALFNLTESDLATQRNDLAMVLAKNPNCCSDINDLKGPPYAFVSLGFRFDIRKINGPGSSGYDLTIGNNDRYFFIKYDGCILERDHSGYKKSLDPITSYLLTDMIIRVVGSQHSK